MIIDLRTMSLLQSKRAHAHVVPLQASPLAILLVDSHRKAEWQPTRPRCWCPVLGPSELEPHGVRCATTSSFEESTTTPFVKPLFPWMESGLGRWQVRRPFRDDLCVASGYESVEEDSDGQQWACSRESRLSRGISRRIGWCYGWLQASSMRQVIQERLESIRGGAHATFF